MDRNCLREAAEEHDVQRRRSQESHDYLILKNPMDVNGYLRPRPGGCGHGSGHSTAAAAVSTPDMPRPPLNRFRKAAPVEENDLGGHDLYVACADDPVGDKISL